MKKAILFLFILLSISCRVKPKQVNADEKLTATIYEILKLSNKKDIKKINEKYIHSEFGIYEVSRIGITDEVKHWNDIKIEKSALGTIFQIITNVNVEDYSKEIIKYNVNYNCDDFEWEKKGLFFSNIITNHRISEVFKKNKVIEANNYRIVLTEKDLIFYLTKIDDNFYITLIDRVTTDCSA